MLPNTNILNKINKFASIPVSFEKFMEMLQSTSRNNPMYITWQTTNAPSHRVTYAMAWGKSFSNSEQSQTKENEGMVNLEAPDTSEGWRTLTYDGIYSFTFDNQRYIIY